MLIAFVGSKQIVNGSEGCIGRRRLGRTALTAGSRKSFLPLQQLEKGTAPQNSTSRSAFKRVGQTPGCATEAMLIENDIEETIEGERAEDESEDEEVYLCLYQSIRLVVFNGCIRMLL